jgi:hypothetical protein
LEKRELAAGNARQGWRIVTARIVNEGGEPVNTSSFACAWRRGTRALALIAAVVFTAGHAGGLHTQGAQQSPSAKEPQGYARVLKGANMHAGVGTAPVVLFMLPAGTVLPVIERTGRDGVWVVVSITPEVRKKATRMRWRDEDRGYVHASTVEFIKSPTG